VFIRVLLVGFSLFRPGIVRAPFSLDDIYKIYKVLKVKNRKSF